MKRTVNKASDDQTTSSITPLVELVNDLTQANKDLYQARKAALNLLEDAIQSREALAKAELALRESETRLAKELIDTKILQRVSSSIIEADNIEMLYDEILNAAKTIMHADMSSLQTLSDEKNALYLLRWNGFHPESAKSWEWIEAGSDTVCGIAFSEKSRIIVPDIDNWEVLESAQQRVPFHLSGIRAVQSTPLVSRSGKIIGMLSTYWKKIHQPSEYEFNLFDVIARQTADVIERKRSEDALRENEEKLKGFNTHLEQQVAERTRELKESREVLYEKNQQLNQTVSQLETFNYLASHDLREPLRKIQTFVNLVNQKKPNADQLNAYLGSIHESAKRMNNLINDLLDYSRLSRPDEAFHWVDLNKILEDVKVDYEMAIHEKQALIENEKLPTIHAVPFQMHQLFSNLIGNALKFNEGKPHLKISANLIKGDEAKDSLGLNPQKKYAEVTFADNGIGFDNKYQEKIFEVFQRLHPKSEYGGTGIGLSIVKKIAKNHHGSVHAEGGSGKGATFSVYLATE